MPVDVVRLRPENDEADDLNGCAKAYTGRRKCQGRHFLLSTHPLSWPVAFKPLPLISQRRHTRRI